MAGQAIPCRAHALAAVRPTVAINSTSLRRRNMPRVNTTMSQTNHSSMTAFVFVNGLLRIYRPWMYNYLLNPKRIHTKKKDSDPNR